ncbi:MAG: hypothetical protein JNK74_25135 [Candidatus Hydrogenedentes bacterium]|nr:hypothetical protein [Candidatus Hydrogenedentota bacterium]
MKKSLILTIASALTIATLGSAAYAENTIDKGDLGKYVRQGRFVKPVLTSSLRTEAVAGQTQRSAVIDKGDLGSYERTGRFLKPVLEVGHQGWSADAAVPVSNVAHKHGLDGKEHRNIGHKRAS